MLRAFVAKDAPMPAPASLKPMIPGSPISDQADDDGVADAPVAGYAAKMSELEAMIAQQNAMIAQLMAQASSAPSQSPASAGASRLIGIDWSSKTAAQAHAEGCTQRVLCSDGYYVPG